MLVYSHVSLQHSLCPFQDTGVSVRKRVIKILKDICLECPDFDKIPEICVKMIRRINDEEGIKKLVQEVFQVLIVFEYLTKLVHCDTSFHVNPFFFFSNGIGAVCTLVSSVL